MWIYLWKNTLLQSVSKYVSFMVPGQQINSMLPWGPSQIFQMKMEEKPLSGPDNTRLEVSIALAVLLLFVFQNV